MSDDLEPRLRNAFREAPLPSAPAGLVDALERIPDARVARRARSGLSIWAPLAVAATNARYQRIFRFCAQEITALAVHSLMQRFVQPGQS